MTDTCDFCYLFNKLKKDISNSLNSIPNFEYSEIFNPTELLNYFIKKQQMLIETGNSSTRDREEIEDLIKKLEKCEIIIEHRKTEQITERYL